MALHTSLRIAVAFGIFLAALTGIHHSAQAACTSPDGIAGGITWNGTDSVIWCDGTNWYALKNAASAAGSTGQVQFNGGSGAFSADTALTWDNTNKRLGIGTSTPRYSFHVGAGSNTLSIYNGNGTTLFTPQIVAQPTSGVAGVGAFVNNGTNNRGAALFMNDTDTLWGLSQANSSGGAVPFVIRQHSIGEVLRIDSSGRVGIATASPSYLLSLGGEAARTIGMERTSTGTNGLGLTILAGGAKSATADLNGGDLTLSSGTATGTGSSNIYFATATAGTTATTDRTPATKMTILGNGNVGIGTGSPGVVLDVRATGDANTNIARFLNGDLATNGNTSFIVVGKNSGSNSARLGYVHNTVSGNEGIYIVNSGDSYATAGLFLKQGGKVGIGTTSPLGYLHVTKGASTVSAVDSNADNLILEGASNAGLSILTTAAGVGRIVFGKPGGGNNNSIGGLYFNQSTGGLSLQTAATARLSIDSTGNVGIGTSTPAATLDVNGFMRLAKNAVQPAACSAANDGAFALTSQYTTCACKGGSTAWVQTSDGTTSCTW